MKEVPTERKKRIAALSHFTVDQMRRSEGQSAIVPAVHRSGERLYSEYYGGYSDYTRKGGVICSGILLPPHVPPEFADRQTLWNTAEQVEQGKRAQLVYNFGTVLQNEFTIEENVALARQFLLGNFVSQGMTVNVVLHEKETEDGGIPDLHFHFLYSMHLMNPDGIWGFRQHRVYRLDEGGNRIRGQNGKFLFGAVPTTGWGSPETLEHWRKAQADVCNTKFEERGLNVRIGHHSYLRQRVDLLPTVREGVTVRAMKKKGIRTEKGEFNRRVKAANAVIWDIRKKIALLSDWIEEIKAKLAKPQTPDLVLLLRAYYSKRSAGIYSQKGRISNLKEMNETSSYLRENGVCTLEDLESWVESHHTKADSLETIMDTENARTRAICSLSDDSNTFQWLKLAYEGSWEIRFDKPRATYEAEYEAELKQFYAARRKLTVEFPDGKVNMKKLSEEYGALAQMHTTTYEWFRSVRKNLQWLWKVKPCVDTAACSMKHTEGRMLQNQPRAQREKESIPLRKNMAGETNIVPFVELQNGPQVETH